MTIHPAQPVDQFHDHAQFHDYLRNQLGGGLNTQHPQLTDSLHYHLIAQLHDPLIRQLDGQLTNQFTAQLAAQLHDQLHAQVTKNNSPP